MKKMFNESDMRIIQNYANNTSTSLQIVSKVLGKYSF